MRPVRGRKATWLNFKGLKTAYSDFRQIYESYREKLHGNALVNEKIYNFVLTLFSKTSNFMWKIKITKFLRFLFLSSKKHYSFHEIWCKITFLCPKKLNFFNLKYLFFLHFFDLISKKPKFSFKSKIFKSKYQIFLNSKYVSSL